VNTCDGFACVDESPSPKSQLHDVGALVDVSVNCTVSGAGPLDGVIVNAATGATTTTVTVVAGDVSEPPAFVAVRVTLYVPAPENT
jgi:hypothetical protein